MKIFEKSMHSLRPWIRGHLSKGKVDSIKAGQSVWSGYAVRRGATTHFFNIDRIGL